MGARILGVAGVAMICLMPFAQNSARAEGIRVDVSQDVIKVTTGFDGATLTVFGVSDKGAGDVVLVVEGPQKTFIVREKGRRLGLWTNVSSRSFVNVPTYYEVASSTALKDIAHRDVLREYGIGVDNLILREKRSGNTARIMRYRRALIKHMQDKGLYITGQNNSITQVSPSLFKTEFVFPDKVTPGRYGVYAYLFNEGQLIGHDQVRFEVLPEGLSADIMRASQDNRVVYGFFAVMMALSAGWLATVLLKRD